MKEIITAVILFILAAGVFVISIRSFMGKGYLVNNAYIFASKAERKRMNKEMYYRQSAVGFFMLSVIFVLEGLQVLTAAKWLFYAVMVVAGIVVLYAIISTIIYVKNEIKGKN